MGQGIRNSESLQETRADRGFFQRGGCKFESSTQTSQGLGNGGEGGWEWGRVGRVRVMFEYVDFLHFDFRGI